MALNRHGWSTVYPFKTGTFSPSPPQKRHQSAIRVVRLSENLCFSTFFSTVVENFGG
jgi:hypothetical protein